MTQPSFQRSPASILDRRAQFSRRRLWNSCLVVIGVVIADIYGLSLGAGATRYAIIVLPLVLVGAGRGRRNRITISGPAASDYPLLLLLVFGTAGSVYGVVIRHDQSPWLALFLPMTVGLLHLTTLGGVTEHEAATYLRRLSWILAAYVGIHAASALGLLKVLGGGGADPAASLAGAVFGHEKSFLLCTALVAAGLLRRKWLLVVLIGLTVVAFLAYPAATYLVAATVAIMTLVATGRRGTRVRAYLLGGLTVVLLAFVVIEVASAAPGTRSKVSTTYYAAVGKSDNTETRSQLWGEAWHEMARSPIAGSAFTGNTALHVVLAGTPSEVPPHNDFLQMGMGGGFLGLGLFLAWVILANMVAFERFRLIKADGEVEKGKLLRTLLVGFNSFLAVALLNPVMSRSGLEVVAMIFYCLLMTVGPPSSTTALNAGPPSAA